MGIRNFHIPAMMQPYGISLPLMGIRNLDEGETNAAFFVLITPHGD